MVKRQHSALRRSRGWIRSRRFCLRWSRGAFPGLTWSHSSGAGHAWQRCVARHPECGQQSRSSGRTLVDFKISRGAADKTLVEFKLASTGKLKRQLKNQTPIYEKAHDTNRSIKAILYFSEKELKKVRRILKELKMDLKDVVLIDARRDTKPSASVA